MLLILDLEKAAGSPFGRRWDHSASPAESLSRHTQVTQVQQTWILTWLHCKWLQYPWYWGDFLLCWWETQDYTKAESDLQQKTYVSDGCIQLYSGVSQEIHTIIHMREICSNVFNEGNVFNEAS